MKTHIKFRSVKSPVKGTDTEKNAVQVGLGAHKSTEAPIRDISPLQPQISVAPFDQDELLVREKRVQAKLQMIKEADRAVVLTALNDKVNSSKKNT